MKIPKITYVDITVAQFKAEAMKYDDSRAPPKYNIYDIVAIKGFMGTLHPALIIGISLRVGGWTYSARSFDRDGKLDTRECVHEKEIEPIEDETIN